MKSVLDFPINTPSITTIGSKASVGKSSLAIMIASEFINKDKKVLYISDDSDKLVLEKFSKLINNGSLTIKNLSTYQYSELKDFISKQNVTQYDLIVLDTPTQNSKFCDVIFQIRNKGISVISTVQFRDFGSLNKEFMYMSDTVVELKKYNLNSFEKIKYFILFWKTKPNRLLNVIKTRRYNNYSKKITIDFQNLKIK